MFGSAKYSEIHHPDDPQAFAEILEKLLLGKISPEFIPVLIENFPIKSWYQLKDADENIFISHFGDIGNKLFCDLKAYLGDNTYKVPLPSNVFRDDPVFEQVRQHNCNKGDNKSSRVDDSSYFTGQTSASEGGNVDCLTQYSSSYEGQDTPLELNADHRKGLSRTVQSNVLLLDTPDSQSTFNLHDTQASLQYGPAFNMRDTQASLQYGSTFNLRDSQVSQQYGPTSNLHVTPVSNQTRPTVDQRVNPVEIGVNNELCRGVNDGLFTDISFQIITHENSTNVPKVIFNWYADGAFETVFKELDSISNDLIAYDDSANIPHELFCNY